MVSSSAVPQGNETIGMESISADLKIGPNNESTPTVGGDPNNGITTTVEGGGGTSSAIGPARVVSGSNNDQSPAIASGNGPSVELRLLVLK